MQIYKEDHAMKQKSSALCVKETFLSLYDAGEFEPGNKIPSETQMVQRLGVSRVTWRKAVDLLQRDGILVSKHGSGTYLVETPPRIINDLAQLQSISAIITNAGIQERKSNITCTLRPVSKQISQFFEADANELFLSWNVCVMQILVRSVPASATSHKDMPPPWM